MEKSRKPPPPEMTLESNPMMPPSSRMPAKRRGESGWAWFPSYCWRMERMMSRSCVRLDRPFRSMGRNQSESARASIRMAVPPCVTAREKVEPRSLRLYWPVWSRNWYTAVTTGLAGWGSVVIESWTVLSIPGWASRVSNAGSMEAHPPRRRIVPARSATSVTGEGRRCIGGRIKRARRTATVEAGTAPRAGGALGQRQRPLRTRVSTWGK
jgi:hypothetical protein